MHENGQNREDYVLTLCGKILGFAPTAHCTIDPWESLDEVAWTMYLGTKREGCTESTLGPQRDRRFWTVHST